MILVLYFTKIKHTNPVVQKGSLMTFLKRLNCHSVHPFIIQVKKYMDL